jgi:Fe-Mn family superoxide dismutase
MIETKRFDSIRELKGISEKTMTEHYKLYEGYVKKFNEIWEKLQTVDLASANQIFSDIRSLKVEMTFALGGVKNHEIYFGHLGGEGGEPTGKLADQIKKDMGSFEEWKSYFKATAMAGRGWAFLVYDRDQKRLFDIIGDSQNTYPIWNSVPIVALDVYEHAYFMDYGIKRAEYIDAFFDNVDWKIVEKSFEAVIS